jgi:SulP family sulfate permease
MTSWQEKWTPRSIECLRNYSLRTLSQDLIAGVTVGLVALPLAMAFAIASGVAPQAGIYTAVIAGFLISALGGSRTQIGGPTGAFVVIVAGIVMKFGLPGLALGAISLAVILLWPRITRRIPGSIVALLLATAVSAALHLHTETIGSRFGGIPQGFPHFAFPDFHAEHIIPLLPSALTVALLAAVESLLSAVVADGMSGDRHNSNMELVAQGVANLASPLFGGIPATGAIARTATNIRSGARTPIAGMVHALTLLAILLVAAPMAKFVPLATLAAVLFVVAYNMGEWREIATIMRLSRTDIAVWITTFALTVLADLTVAVAVGMALAALLYIYRIAETTTVAPVTASYLRDGNAHILQGKDIPANVSILRIHGPFLFGTTEKLAEETKDLNKLGEVVILRLRNMTALDATGIHALEQFSNRLRKVGKVLLICGLRDQPSREIEGSDFLQHLGTDNMLPHVQAALERARQLQGDFGGIGRETAAAMARQSL